MYKGIVGEKETKAYIHFLGEKTCDVAIMVMMFHRMNMCNMCCIDE